MSELQARASALAPRRARDGSQEVLPRGPLRRWGGFFLCILLVCAFVFLVAPAIQRLGAIEAVHANTRDHGIDATGLIYSETKEFSDADGYIRDAMKY
ncbi:MAG: hypothetical protein JXQ73_10240 [Phycisphaerae bacterium]|nr:hypothetical protein [Phycisphaerae bacterium]